MFGHHEAAILLRVFVEALDLDEEDEQYPFPSENMAVLES